MAVKAELRRYRLAKNMNSGKNTKMTLAVIKTVLKPMTIVCLTVVATTAGASVVAVITTGFSDFLYQLKIDIFNCD